ncbi:hypothetical protein H4Q26_013120 [Puccinia striiformis f. sp. tritici PST-130]|nr:hypothetical protein H4Q26_013120 [Puccinia striiformis f. sp. tritici PST-130]
MSKPNNTNTTQPSYIPPSPDPRFVETPEFYPPCERCSNLELVCGQSTKAAGKGKADKCERCRVKKVVCKRLPKLVTEDERKVRRKVWTDPKTGETSVYPYTAVESPPQSTPNDKELIELEQETAAPWVTGKKRLNQVNTGPSDLSVHSPRFALLQAARRGKSKRTREQLEEDEILQEVLEEEAAIARLTEAAKNQELVAGPSKRIRLIVGSTPDTEEDVNTGRRYENSLENLGGGFLRNNVEEEDFEEVEGVGNERGQGEEEEEEREEEEEEEEREEEEEEEGEEYVEEKEQESGPFERETTWKGIATEEEEEVLEIDEGFVVAEKEVRLDANEVPEEKDRLFNWSSDDEEEIDVLRKSKEEMKSKAVAKLMKMIPKGLKEEAKIVRRDLAEAVEGKIKDANKFLEKEF